MILSDMCKPKKNIYDILFMSVKLMSKYLCINTRREIFNLFMDLNISVDSLSLKL